MGTPKFSASIFLVFCDHTECVLLTNTTLLLILPKKTKYFQFPSFIYRTTFILDFHRSVHSTCVVLGIFKILDFQVLIFSLIPSLFNVHVWFVCF